MRLSVIIVNYNVRCFLEQCLFTVETACRKLNVEVFVVDNASTDDSKTFFEDRFPAVRFIWHPQNSGYSRANNLALGLATGEYVLFLNPDTLLSEDCLEKAIEFLDARPEAGAAGIRMIDGKGNYLPESKRGRPTLTTSFYKLSGLANLFPNSKRFARYYLGHLNPAENHQVEVLAGAFLLAKRIVLEKTGGFDERFFMYGEDIDLSYRIQQAGYSNHYFAESTIIHFKGESTQQEDRGKYIRLFYGAMHLFVSKHYRSGTALFYKGFIGMSTGVSLLLAFLKQLIPKGGPVDQTIRRRRCLLIGSDTAVKGARRILEANNLHYDDITVLKASVYSSLRSQIAHCLASEPLMKEYGGLTVIFCMDADLMPAIVFQLMSFPIITDLNRDINFAFYARGSASIVSSLDKNTTGQWLVMDNRT